MKAGEAGRRAHRKSPNSSSIFPVKERHAYLLRNVYRTFFVVCLFICRTVSLHMRMHTEATHSARLFGRYSYNVALSATLVWFLNYSQTTGAFCSNTSRALNILLRCVSLLAGANEASYCCRFATLHFVSVAADFSGPCWRVTASARKNVPAMRRISVVVTRNLDKRRAERIKAGLVDVITR